MQSSKFYGYSLNNLTASLNCSILVEDNYYFSNNKILFKFIGLIENNFPNLSLAHSTQCKVSSGNIFKVQ